MTDNIYISPDSLYTKLIKNVPDELDEATTLLQKVLGSVQLSAAVPCGEQWHVFSSNVQEEANLSLERLRKAAAISTEVCKIAASAPVSYTETDRGFKNTLRYSWIERVKIRLNDYRANAIPNRSFSEVMHSLFAKDTENVEGFTVVNADHILPESTAAACGMSATAGGGKHKAKVKMGDDNPFSEAIKDIWNTEIDNSREGSTHERSYGGESYGRFTSGTFSLLGSDFGYNKYLDYNSAEFTQKNGDSFYSYDAEVKREGTHIDFYELAPNGVEGELVMNGVSSYADGDFDLAKGNAYMRAGADYSMCSLKTTWVSDTALTLDVSGEIGAGAHLNIGIHNGKFTADVGAALGIGGSVSFELDYEQCWEDIKDILCIN